MIINDMKNSVLERITIIFVFAIFIVFPVISLHFCKILFLNDINDDNNEISYFLTIVLNIMAFYILFFYLKKRHNSN